jgi:hypothetical protein
MAVSGAKARPVLPEETDLRVGYAESQGNGGLAMFRAFLCSCLASVVALLACTELIGQGDPAPRFVQIPGPNPLLKPGPEGNWDDGMLEASDAFFDDGITYFYYHAVGAGQGYRLGVATASHPLGPFRKHGMAPIVDSGPAGTWDSGHVACAMVVKESAERYLMWYSGEAGDAHWSIGLATASHPLGPWVKHPENPVLEDFGYLGGVLKIGDEWRLYAAHPIHQPWASDPAEQHRSPTYHTDYSPLSLAVGIKPEGPFQLHPGNPLMVQGELGEWNEGGISEAEVLYQNGRYHIFYGASQRHGPRTESIGYAWSEDGLKWTQHPWNPIASRHAEPNAAAYAEVHAVMQSPFVFLYHTLRYEHDDERGAFPWFEDLGVQVLALEQPFHLLWPVLQQEILEGGKSTDVALCPVIPLGPVERATLTVSCQFSEGDHDAPSRLELLGSADGISFDTVAHQSWKLVQTPGKRFQRTLSIDTSLRFAKVRVVNGKGNGVISGLKVDASLGG